MEKISFNNRNEMKKFVYSNFTYIGEGSQGTCFASFESGLVYKIFNDFLDDDFPYLDGDSIVNYGENEIMRFSLDSDLCSFPIGLIMIENTICGYICKYVKGKNLFKIDPLRVNLDSILTAYERARGEIKNLSSYGVEFYDVMYNILYNGSKKRFYIIDTMDFATSFSTSSLLYEINLKRFNVEIKKFMIDGYFDNFVSGYADLFFMYNNDSTDVSSFINLFRYYVYDKTKKEITFLRDIKELMDSQYVKKDYERELKRYR